MKRTAVFFLFLGLAIVAGSVKSNDKLSVFDQAGLQLKYESATAFANQDLGEFSASGVKSSQMGRKSPGKALVLSLVVPGLGQFYNGNKVKPWIFLGVEVTAWAMYLKWHGDYNDLTNDFETFQRAHWSREDYATYLNAAYGFSDDDSISAPEISHHLPETETGQYFEMTGKYDQFAWGWDDAMRDGLTLEESLDRPDLAMTVEARVPNSTNRATYLRMRKDANDSYDRAERMIIVSIVNHLISGVEAYIGARRHNKKLAGEGDGDFSSLDLRASVRSFSAVNDTPFLTATVRF
jgi:hypothetical protein